VVSRFRLVGQRYLSQAWGALCLASALVATPLSALSVTDSASDSQAQQLITAYVDAWRDFYPSQAFAYGDVQSASAFEDFGGNRVGLWLDHNAEIQRGIRELVAAGELSADLQADLAMLAEQVRREQSDWAVDQPLAQQPQWFAELVSQALTHLLVREQLSPEARSQAAIERLDGVASLCETAVVTLEGGNRLRTERALRVLAGTRTFYSGGLAEYVATWPQAQDVTLAAADAATAIAALEKYLRDTVLPDADDSVSMGADAYTAKLTGRSLGNFDPPGLAAAARAEVQEVRRLMVLEARRWQQADEKDLTGADDDQAILAAAIEAMENDRQDNSADFLEEFRQLTFASEEFVKEHGLATVPEPTTLYVALSPAHFSGAAVGGVYPSGPFAPNADTLFYVPSIPDSAEPEAKEGFYRSFNTHFNTMIISHEMFPGHYLQYKVAVTHAPALRSLFPDGAYVEGWGSFVEELMLDAGWADNAPLTRLAHLRKRLENATRAYVSVQVHTAGWGEAEVMGFAVEEGLLAPQFAANLWQRVVHTPMQITDYFRGFQRFQQLYANKSTTQSTGQWVDAVLNAGPLPISLLEPLLQSTP